MSPRNHNAYSLHSYSYCSRSSCYSFRQRRLRKLASPLGIGPPALPVYEQPLFVRETGIFGRLATRPAITTSAITLGCRAHRWWDRKWVSCGLLPIRRGAATDLFSMTATGVRMWASTAASIMASDISAWALKAGVGTADTFSTTVP